MKILSDKKKKVCRIFNYDLVLSFNPLLVSSKTKRNEQWGHEEIKHKRLKLVINIISTRMKKFGKIKQLILKN